METCAHDLTLSVYCLIPYKRVFIHSECFSNFRLAVLNQTCPRNLLLQTMILMVSYSCKFTTEAHPLRRGKVSVPVLHLTHPTVS